MLKVIQRNIHSLYLLLVLSSLAFISGSVLSSSTVSADDSVVDEINITVPTSCSMTGTGMNTHNAEITNGNYVQNIGTTTLHTFCNDNNGFAIYAAGYTGNEIGETNSNKLVGTNATNNLTIDTGLATSAGNPDVSNWAMKLAITQDSGDTTGTNAFTIDSAPNTSGGADASFTQYHVVPNEYTKVAHKNSATDMTTTTGGVKLTTTYAAYVSKTQPADTYTGQVIYTLVHPSDHSAPVANPAILDTGKTVNSKLKSLAATVVNGEDTTITPEFDPEGSDWDDGYDEYIKSIIIHTDTVAPVGFTPSEKNTISTADSKKPIYAVFDNTNDAGIMHFYTEGEQVFLSPDSSFIFYMLYNLSEVSGISDWDTSNATNMSYMFYHAGESASTFTLDLSSWDTSNVTDMGYMFQAAGYPATTWSIGDLSDWNTSSATDMFAMFYLAGNSATTWSIGDLSDWNTSSATDMTGMFHGAGSSATTWSIGNLSSWDISNVTSIASMFCSAGSRATIWSIGDLSSWDTSSVTNMFAVFDSAGSRATTWSVGDLSSWDTSSVTRMDHMFASAGRSATTFSLDLSSWNTSSVTEMTSMFYYAGYSATTFNLDLSSWNTSSVTNMASMFYSAGYSATTFSLDLSSWNTSSVTNMSNMFYDAGYSATTWSIGDLSTWDTSNVTNMSYMFYRAGYSATTFTLSLSSWSTTNATSMTYMFNTAGYSATTWSVTIPPTNGGGINNTISRMYGKTSSVYVTPPGGKNFTLARP